MRPLSWSISSACGVDLNKNRELTPLRLEVRYIVASREATSEMIRGHRESSCIATRLGIYFANLAPNNLLYSRSATP
jgi:hypothetical protein